MECDVLKPLEYIRNLTALNPKTEKEKTGSSKNRDRSDFYLLPVRKMQRVWQNKELKTKSKLVFDVFSKVW